MIRISHPALIEVGQFGNGLFIDRFTIEGEIMSHRNYVLRKITPSSLKRLERICEAPFWNKTGKPFEKGMRRE